MAKAFDATMKQLLDNFGGEWVKWLAPRIGLPANIGVDPLDVDLSTVQFAADKVFRLQPPAEGLLHLEPQSSRDGELAERMHIYSALLTQRYKIPVHSVALLLRPEANATNLSGSLERTHTDGKTYLRFEYDVIRVWELPCEPLLATDASLAPLALLTDEANGRLPELVSRMDREMRDADEPESKRKLILASTYLLLGLRYNEEAIQTAFLGVQGMKESTTYQAILREGLEKGIEVGREEGIEVGREEGREEGQKFGISLGLVIARRDTLLAILRDRFPNVPADVKSQIEDCADVTQLQTAILRAIHIDRIEDLNF